ncbi:MAG: sigma-70 family RNA polymerase sigma factor, partial [Acidimicrobiales bacterium]
MDDQDLLSQRFEAHRDRLLAVGYRMLGTRHEAEDAVQEVWLRLSRTDAGAIENLGGWLTTVAGRVCLDMLRARASRREIPADTASGAGGGAVEGAAGGPAGAAAVGADPEGEALLADSVGRALQVVLDALSPAERLAFVLHDLFAVPFEEIAPIVGRTPVATRQLASRARKRVRTDPAVPDTSAAVQQDVVAAFLAAAHEGEFARLLQLLDPE